MTESEAQAWLAREFGEPGIRMMRRMVEIVTAESACQNLVSASTVSALWSRHVVDSAQLIALAGAVQGPWVDVGSGAGFPGLVVAGLTDFDVVLVEPRRRRADFLRDTAAALALRNVSVVATKVEAVAIPAGIVSARAVASLDAIFTATIQLARLETVWVLPKGRSALAELAQARRAWHGVFHVEQSITDPSSHIIVATEVGR